MKNRICILFAFFVLLQTAAQAYVTGGEMTQTPTNVGNVQKTTTSNIESLPAWHTTATMISTCQDLQNIAYSEKSLQGVYGLANDIDCTQSMTWNQGAGFVPIGSGADAKPFTGKLIGYGHVIRGLSVNASKVFSFQYTKSNGQVVNAQVNEMEPKGLFGRLLNAEIVLVTIEQANIQNVGKDVGILAGQIENTIIDRVQVSGDITWNSLDGLQRFESVNAAMGGLIGINGKGSAIIKSSADVTIKGRGMVGGLVGLNNSYVYESFSRVQPQLSNSGNEFGGLIGRNAPPEKFTDVGIMNVYAQSNFDKFSNLGGSLAGGLIGHDFKGKVVNAYAITNAHFESYGALVGEAQNSEWKNAFWDKELSNNVFPGQGLAGQGLSTKAALAQETYKGFDFNKNWQICQGPLVVGDYPSLTWQKAVCVPQTVKKSLMPNNALDAEQFGKAISASANQVLITKGFNINVYRLNADALTFDYSFDLVTTLSNDFKPSVTGDFFYAFDENQATVEIFYKGKTGRFVRIGNLDVSDPEFNDRPNQAVINGNMVVVTPKEIKSYAYSNSAIKQVGNAVALKKYWPTNAIENHQVTIKAVSLSETWLALLAQVCAKNNGVSCQDSLLIFNRTSVTSNWVSVTAPMISLDRLQSIAIRDQRMFVMNADKVATYALNTNGIALLNTASFKGHQVRDLSQDGRLATYNNGILYRWIFAEQTHQWSVDRKITLAAVTEEMPVVLAGNLFMVGNMLETVNNKPVVAVNIFQELTDKTIIPTSTQNKSTKAKTFNSNK